jgi:ABC-type polysaccharide/polyol phosphate transport system ATPase subunit
LLTGIYLPTAGTLEVSGTAVALFNAGIGFIKDLSVLDNIFLCGAIYGMPRHALRGRIDAILATAGVPHLAHAPFKDLSSGQAQRLGLSIFFQSEHPLMVFDEALTNVDRVFAAHADHYFQALAASPKTVLMTSHDGALLVRHCRRAIWLEDGLVRADGGAADVVAAYEAACRDAARAPR